MQCPRCDAAVASDVATCPHCGEALPIVRLEVVRGDVPDKLFPLRPGAFTVGRAKGNDVMLPDPSVSKLHARLTVAEGGSSIEDQGSRHGVYVDATRVQRGDLRHDSHVQLGNVTLRFAVLRDEGSAAKASPYPWLEQQKLLLSLVRALNSTLVVSEVLEHVVDAVMTITGAERGFLLLEGEEGSDGAEVGGLQVRVARRRLGEKIPLADVQGLSGSVVRKALATGEAVATGNAMADPGLRTAQSVILLDLRTIVCIPLLSAGVEGDGGSGDRTLGAIYVDNPETSAPISVDSLSTAEALSRHAALAIANAQLFESEQGKTRELREAQSRLLQSEKLATIGQMAAGIAHELNTPLTYIMGNVELLQGQALTAPQSKMLTSIDHGAERIKGLVQSLLAFSRPAAEAPAPLSVNGVVERSLELCRYQILKGGVQLQKQLAEPSPRVMGVSNQLEMALINLVVNAIHAMNGGGTLTVGTAARGAQVEIAVADTGHGVPEAIRSTIFEPFFTTKPEGKGTGLGLATVLMIVERHGGRIDLDSAPGRGTTFRILLPAA
jgi:signal transduction histidine kinase